MIAKLLKLSNNPLTTNMKVEEQFLGKQAYTFCRSQRQTVELGTRLCILSYRNCCSRIFYAQVAVGHTEPQDDSTVGYVDGTSCDRYEKRVWGRLHTTEKMRLLATSRTCEKIAFWLVVRFLTSYDNNLVDEYFASHGLHFVYNPLGTNLALFFKMMIKVIM